MYMSVCVSADVYLGWWTGRTAQRGQTGTVATGQIAVGRCVRIAQSGRRAGRRQMIRGRMDQVQIVRISVSSA